MKDEQKRIDEMAKDICNCLGGNFGYEACCDCFGENDNYFGCKGLAEALYNAGYRKLSDTAREILRMIKDKGLFRYGGYLLHDSDFDTVGKLYGVEVEE